jgi:membrane protein implicated in regulation of membrane protease activity
MHWSIWITGSIILFVFEIITPGGFFFACLGAGALITALSALLVPGELWQWVIFAVISLVSIYSIRPIARKYFQKGEKKSNVDALIGKTAHVTEPANPPALGVAKVEGEIWRVEADEKLEKGDMVEIVAVEGTRLKVKKTR